MENFRPCHIRRKIDGEIVRTIPKINRARSANALVEILHEIGEINLTVYITQRGKAGQIIEGRCTGGIYTGDKGIVWPEGWFEKENWDGVKFTGRSL